MTATRTTTSRAEPSVGVRPVATARRESRHHPRLCRICQRPMSRQEDACWRCGARVRHVHFSGRQTHDAIPPPARGPEHSDALSCLVRRRRADHRFASRAVVGLEVHDAGRADPLPSRAEDHARWQAERLDARRRQKQQLHELAAAIDVGDAAYRRLRERLDDFGTRLAVVRLTLNTTPADRPLGTPRRRGFHLEAQLETAAR